MTIVLIGIGLMLAIIGSGWMLGAFMEWRWGPPEKSQEALRRAEQFEQELEQMRREHVAQLQAMKEEHDRITAECFGDET